MGDQADRLTTIIAGLLALTLCVCSCVLWPAEAENADSVGDDVPLRLG